MSKTAAAANVIDLDAFRQKKRMAETKEEDPSTRPAAVLVPVWYCWVPVWAPVLT